MIDLEDELKALTFKELDGSKVRSPVQWLEEGEKPTHFLKLEHERFERNTVCSILDSDEVEVFTREEIEWRTCSFILICPLKILLILFVNNVV